MSIKTQCLSPYFFTVVESFQRFQHRKGIVTLVDFYTVEKKKEKTVLSFDFIPEMHQDRIEFRAFSSKIIMLNLYIVYNQTNQISNPFDQGKSIKFRICVE